MQQPIHLPLAYIDYLLESLAERLSNAKLFKASDNLMGSGVMGIDSASGKWICVLGSMLLTNLHHNRYFEAATEELNLNNAVLRSIEESIMVFGSLAEVLAVAYKALDLAAAGNSGSLAPETVGQSRDVVDPHTFALAAKLESRTSAFWFKLLPLISEELQKVQAIPITASSRLSRPVARCGWISGIVSTLGHFISLKLFSWGGKTKIEIRNK